MALRHSLLSLPPINIYANGLTVHLTFASLSISNMIYSKLFSQQEKNYDSYLSRR